MFFSPRPPPTATHPLSLHDALPISEGLGDEDGDTIRETGRVIAAIRSLIDSPPADGGLPVLFLAADDLQVTTWSPGSRPQPVPDRKSTRLNSSHVEISYAVFCLKKK